MPLEGHSSDCDCGCCGFEAEPETKVQTKFVCSTCGNEKFIEPGKASATMKCPSCGAPMQAGK